MRDFHVYLMDPNDHIITRKDILADSLEDAVRIGFERLQQHKDTLLHPGVGIEIWSGTERLFAGKPDDPTGLG